MMKPFPEAMLEHLGAYRRDILRISEPGIFYHKGRSIPKDHILPEGSLFLNVLPLIRQEAMSLKCAGSNVPIKWHRYASHLNSSQLLAVNLFLPLLCKQDANRAMLARALGMTAPCVSPTGFEWIPDTSEGTNIDFVATGNKGERVLMELKLTEREFGIAIDDEKHRLKFCQIYQERLKGKIRLPLGHEWHTFRHHYQVFRNVLFAGDGHRVWFVLPKGHERLWKLAEQALAFVEQEVRQFVEVKTLADVLDAIEAEVSCNESIRLHYAAFREKYKPALL